MRIAVIQSQITPDVAQNGEHIRAMLAQAAAKGAALALFPEGALSGYAKAQVCDWALLDWRMLEMERKTIAKCAQTLGIIAVVGSAHPLAGQRPHNSLYALPTSLRYDKRLLSNTEVNGWYTPGFEEGVLELADFSFGITICIEMQFAELFASYEARGVDAVLHATYGMGPLGDVILRAHAALNCLWIAVATPANADKPASGIVAPNGEWICRCDPGIGFAVGELDHTDPELEIALQKAKPWRRRAREGQIYRNAL